MAKLNIIKFTDQDNEILRSPARPVDSVTPRIITLLDDMTETMNTANGVGLAAPQVGVRRRVMVALDTDDENKLYEFINPCIIKSSGKETDSEGCLSIPGMRGDVERPKKVIVRALNRKGEEFELTARDFFARVICHEIDHLNGILTDNHTELYRNEE
ncbi:MAG: peptide deformylase [Oscillospiraceae bacterium]|nr:peptide deformylase [Oscillospiraceae bacterium]